MSMARTWLSKTIALGCLALAVAAALACRSTLCSGTATTVPIVVRVQHVSGGPAPLVYSLTVFGDRTITLETVGLRPLCRTCGASELARIQRILGSSSMSSVVARRRSLSKRCGGDIERANVITPGPPFHPSLCVMFPLSTEEAPLKELFGVLDGVFSRAFGHRYPKELLSD